MKEGKTEKKRIGILGGTFDQIHCGHLMLAEEAREQFSLDRVLLIPSGCSYMKDPKEVLSARFRYEMTQLAARDNPHLLVSDLEIRRKGNSYTCIECMRTRRCFILWARIPCFTWKSGRIRNRFFKMPLP